MHVTTLSVASCHGPYYVMISCRQPSLTEKVTAPEILAPSPALRNTQTEADAATVWQLLAEYGSLTNLQPNLTTLLTFPHVEPTPNSYLLNFWQPTDQFLQLSDTLISYKSLILERGS